MMSKASHTPKYRWTAAKERELRALDRKVNHLKATRKEVLRALDLGREKRLAAREVSNGR